MLWRALPTSITATVVFVACGGPPAPSPVPTTAPAATAPAPTPLSCLRASPDVRGFDDAGLRLCAYVAETHDEGGGTFSLGQATAHCALLRDGALYEATDVDEPLYVNPDVLRVDLCRAGESDCQPIEPPLADHEEILDAAVAPTGTTVAMLIADTEVEGAAPRAALWDVATARVVAELDPIGGDLIAWIGDLLLVSSHPLDAGEPVAELWRVRGAAPALVWTAPIRVDGAVALDAQRTALVTLDGLVIVHADGRADPPLALDALRAGTLQRGGAPEVAQLALHAGTLAIVVDLDGATRVGLLDLASGALRTSDLPHCAR